MKEKNISYFCFNCNQIFTVKVEKNEPVSNYNPKCPNCNSNRTMKDM